MKFWKNLKQNWAHSNCTHQLIDSNLKNFSNLIQIWTRFEPPFRLVPWGELTNLKDFRLCRYIILNTAKSIKFSNSHFFSRILSGRGVFIGNFIVRLRYKIWNFCREQNIFIRKNVIFDLGNLNFWVRVFRVNLNFRKVANFCAYSIFLACAHRSRFDSTSSVLFH